FGFLARERVALAGQHCKAFESLARFLGETRLERFGVCEAFGHCGQFLAAGGKFGLLCENIFAQRGKAFRGRSGVLLGSGARDKSLFAQEASFRRSCASLFGFGMKASDFAKRFSDLL